ncbi:MAG: DNA adenine methylase [bacterium]
MPRKAGTKQQSLILPFGPDVERLKIPSTRYQGSKGKLAHWIWDRIAPLDFANALDAFGGTAVVSYVLKQRGIRVIYNDYLKSNYYVGLALIENNSTTLSSEDVSHVLTRGPTRAYKTFIHETFGDIYYTDQENQWLDVVTQNIHCIHKRFKRALAYYALFQACLVKRPFNLFHRKNLYIRFGKVKRSFGNKTTWDRPFEEHFNDFVREINKLVFDNGKKNKAYNKDVFDIPGSYDLVYLDPPYTSPRGVSVDYLDFYHFLEGLVRYDDWGSLIDYRTKHRRFFRRPNPWNDNTKLRRAFRELFDRFKDSLLVVSYRSDGIPSIPELRSDLSLFKRRVSVHTLDNYKYVLSNGRTSEVLLIAE